MAVVFHDGNVFLIDFGGATIDFLTFWKEKPHIFVVIKKERRERKSDYANDRYLLLTIDILLWSF